MILIRAYEHLGELVISAEDSYLDDDGGRRTYFIDVQRSPATRAGMAWYDNALEVIAGALLEMATETHVRLKSDEEASPVFP